MSELDVEDLRAIRERDRLCEPDWLPGSIPLYARTAIDDRRALLAYIDGALRALWDCGVAAGMDTDGDAGPEARVAGMGVEWFARSMLEQVRQLRADYDEALAEADSAAPGKPVMSVAMSDADEGQA
jgi:hypothetical protein